VYSWVVEGRRTERRLFVQENGCRREARAEEAKKQDLQADDL